jgi:hypothetical protein
MISACATLMGQKPEEAVSQRVYDRWAALIEGKLETAYTYETPEYRELHSFVDFRKKFKGVGVWQKVDVEKVECEQKKCSVDVRIYVKIKPGLGFDYVETNGQATEKWLQHSMTGKWYHISDQ